SDIKSGGPKKTKDQIQEELAQAAGYASFAAIPREEAAKRLQISRDAETKAAEQVSVKSYTLTDIESMVEGTHPTISLTPDQAIQIFRETWGASGGYTPGAIAQIEAELAAIERAVPYNVTEINKLVAAKSMTKGEAIQHLTDLIEDPRLL